jgi:hypothetical protein
MHTTRTTRSRQATNRRAGRRSNLPRQRRSRAERCGRHNNNLASEWRPTCGSSGSGPSSARRPSGHAPQNARGHSPVTPQSVALCRSSGATSFPCCLSPLRLRAATHVAPRDLSCELRVAPYVVSRGLCAAPDAALCQSPVPPGWAAAPGPRHLTPLARCQALRGPTWPAPKGKKPFDVRSFPI